MPIFEEIKRPSTRLTASDHDLPADRASVLDPCNKEERPIVVADPGELAKSIRGLDQQRELQHRVLAGEILLIWVRNER